ncbi:hypothetical protein Pla175_21190 [Pirellulimonas nuda]|uniref:Tetratricopeptide repeat protein n=1 Tax=Pirellulimonas nuda TaxID=2528009 RepID=A0A518DB85_9BACT|nr:hypothetical protein [Pirellulimonas nuda]QDU88737.1 hypothetical protein Pla175_21190 [Pirellulimonas nuda]
MLLRVVSAIPWLLLAAGNVEAAAPTLESWLLEQRLTFAPSDELGEDERLAEFVRLARSRSEPIELLLKDVEAAPETPPAWLREGPLPAKLVASVQLEIARAMVAGRRYEAALAWLDGLQEQDPPCPATLHYCEAVSRFLLMDLDGAKVACEQLRAMGELSAPRQRYVADVILRQCESLKPGGASFIAMQMRDVERRLSLGRCEEEDVSEQRRVVDALDRLIKEMEKQRGEKSSSAASGSASGQAPAAQPMEESRPGDLKGDGQVPMRIVDGETDWGSMPPAERSRVLQQIQQDFPPHYRAVVEEYFKNLSGSDAPREEPQ